MRLSELIDQVVGSGDLRPQEPPRSIRRPLPRLNPAVADLVGPTPRVDLSRGSNAPVPMLAAQQAPRPEAPPAMPFMQEAPGVIADAFRIGAQLLRPQGTDTLTPTQNTVAMLAAPTGLPQIASGIGHLRNAASYPFESVDPRIEQELGSAFGDLALGGLGVVGMFGMMPGGRAAEGLPRVRAAAAPEAVAAETAAPPLPSSLDLYHGTHREVTPETIQPRGVYNAIWSTDSPELSQAHATRRAGNPQVLQFSTDTQGYAVHDSRGQSLNPLERKAIIDEARARGARGVIFRNDVDGTAARGPSTNVATFSSDSLTPRNAPPRPEPRLPGRASDGSVLPVRPREPFRNSLRGGSDDLNNATRGDFKGPAMTGPWNPRANRLRPDAMADEIGAGNPTSENIIASHAQRFLPGLKVEEWGPGMRTTWVQGRTAPNPRGFFIDANGQATLEEPIPVGSSNHLRNAMQEWLRPSGDAYVRVSDNPLDHDFMASGEHRGSINHATGEAEGGISVYREPYPGAGRYGTFVNGKRVGTGSDGEPLLDPHDLNILSPRLDGEELSAEFQHRLDGRLKELGLSRQDYNDLQNLRLRGWTHEPAPTQPRLPAGTTRGPLRGGSDDLRDAAGMGQQAPQGITAYHGSPHDFDRFSMDHIGNGEGAQAYGHGLYFAENEGVARSYRDQISKDHFATSDGLFDPMSLEHLNVRVRATRGDLQGAIDRAKEVVGSTTTPETTRAMAARDLGRLEQIQRGGGINPHTGHMYQVRINSTPDNFVDLDAPVSAQPPHIRSLLERGLARPRQVAPDTYDIGGLRFEREGQRFRMYRNGKRTGETFASIDEAHQRYGDHPDRMMAGDALNALEPDQVKQAELLRNAGAHGVRYLDQGSRQAGQGTRNYVVMRDDILNITRKYGLPLGLFGGQAALSRRKAASS